MIWNNFTRTAVAVFIIHQSQSSFADVFNDSWKNPKMLIVQERTKKKLSASSSLLTLLSVNMTFNGQFDLLQI